MNGYHLKEYGTLVMNNANRTSYPMIKGGEKVISGLAYGTNANGTYQDSIYETVSGRYRFTPYWSAFRQTSIRWNMHSADTSS